MMRTKGEGMTRNKGVRVTSGWELGFTFSLPFLFFSVALIEN
jgi:hypothetical protein